MPIIRITPTNVAYGRVTKSFSNASGLSFEVGTNYAVSESMWNRVKDIRHRPGPGRRVGEIPPLLFERFESEAHLHSVLAEEAAEARRAEERRNGVKDPGFAPAIVPFGDDAPATLDMNAIDRVRLEEIGRLRAEVEHLKAMQRVGQVAVGAGPAGVAVQGATLPEAAALASEATAAGAVLTKAEAKPRGRTVREAR